MQLASQTRALLGDRLGGARVAIGGKQGGALRSLRRTLAVHLDHQGEQVGAGECQPQDDAGSPAGDRLAEDEEDDEHHAAQHGSDDAGPVARDDGQQEERDARRRRAPAKERVAQHRLEDDRRAEDGEGADGNHAQQGDGRRVERRQHGAQGIPAVEAGGRRCQEERGQRRHREA